VDLLFLAALVLCILYFSAAGLLWASSKEEIRKLEKEKDEEIQAMREKLKRLSEKAKRRRRKYYRRDEKNNL